MSDRRVLALDVAGLAQARLGGIREDGPRTGQPIRC